jgi:hypothetical protein
MISSWIDHDRSQSRSHLARRRELNFGWCLHEGVSSLGSSSDDQKSSYRSLCIFPLLASLANRAARVIFGGSWSTGFVVAGNPAKLWSALSPEGSESASPNTMDLCPSHALFTRPTRTKADGKRPVPDPATSNNSGSCTLRSLNLAATKSKDPRTHLEPERNLVVDQNVIDLT